MERRENNRKKLNIPFLACLLVFIVAVAVAVGYKVKQSRNSKVYDDLKDKAVKTVTPAPEYTSTPAPTKAPDDTATPSPSPTPEPVEIPIDFDVLESTNSDIYAWIEIPGTVVAYPVLQSTTDPEDYYLDHTVERYPGLPGSLYTQMVNEKDFSDYITVIYGHNMINGSFFGAFNYYRSKEYCDEHDTVIIYTREHIYTYKIFACITYDNRLLAAAFDFKTEEGATEYLNSLRGIHNWASYWRDEVEVKEGDKILTMSTCNGNSDQRFLVEAVLTDVQ